MSVSMTMPGSSVAMWSRHVEAHIHLVLGSMICKDIDIMSKSVTFLTLSLIVVSILLITLANSLDPDQDRQKGWV